MNDVAELVIELGINHNSSMCIAREMISKVQLMADLTDFPKDKLFFKLQKRNPEVSVPKHMWNKPRKDLITGEDITYIEYKRRMEFNRFDYYELSHLCDGKLFASVWDDDSVYDISTALPNVPYLKIPSAHLVNDELILSVVATGRPIILSTGMSTEKEIEHAIQLVPSDYGKNLVVMSCTATYPCPDEEINLNKMFEISMLGWPNWVDAAEDFSVGFSSHSPGPFPVLYALAFGAAVVEVHFTLDRTMPGSDHAASLELPAIELIMREAQRVPVLRGDGLFHVYASELDKRKSLRGY